MDRSVISSIEVSQEQTVQAAVFHAVQRGQDVQDAPVVFQVNPPQQPRREEEQTPFVEKPKPAKEFEEGKE